MLSTFPKAFSQVATSQMYNFPKAFSQVTTSQMCNFPMGDERCDWGSCRLGNYTFGKLPFRKNPLGKYLTSKKRYTIFYQSSIFTIIIDFLQIYFQVHFGLFWLVIVLCFVKKKNYTISLNPKKCSQYFYSLVEFDQG